ncbi:MAG: hypothetical protein KBT03_11090 [Bacteroidales bacterium]|nr:hypothetical protein [Candidatus Scybalousia scybalohippi]
MVTSANQHIEFSDKVGGARVVFEGHPYVLTGGYNFDLSALPDYPNVLPAGTPINCNEDTRTIAIHYAFRVVETTATSKTVKLAKDGQGSRVKVGMNLMVAPSTLSTAGQGYEVKSVDTTAADYDVVTLGSDASFSANAILVEADAKTSSAKVKVVPNSLLDRDIVKDAKAKLVNATGVWSNDRPVLENRIPPIAPAIKTALLENGCYFRFSTRK